MVYLTELWKISHIALKFSKVVYGKEPLLNLCSSCDIDICYFVVNNIVFATAFLNDAYAYNEKLPSKKVLDHHKWATRYEV